MRVGLVQLRTPADQAAAFDQAAPLIRQAAQQGAQLVLTPEGSNLLQRDRGKLAGLLRPVADDPFVVSARELARELEIHLLLGSVLVIGEHGQPANRSLLIDSQGEIIAQYDKLHMFDVDLPGGESARESATYRPGERAVVADVGGIRLGLSICYDLRFAALYRALALAGAQVLTVPAAFTRQTGAAHWQVLLRARAIETGSFVLAPAQGGWHPDGRGTYGHSLAVGPWGEVLGELDHDEPGVLMVDLNPEAVARARAAIPALSNARSFSGPTEA
ncbi:MAG: amidohydrolase [Caulobacteraceae bacterium]|nr:amidohydrolase [Caulobacteraceae bacterium]